MVAIIRTKNKQSLTKESN